MDRVTRRNALQLASGCLLGALAGCNTATVSTETTAGLPTTTETKTNAHGQTPTATPTHTRGPIDPTVSEQLIPDDGDRNDGFGGAVALSSDGTTALVGARRDEDPNGPGAGSAYVFAHEDGTWSQQAKLVPEDGDKNDSFGSSVTLANDGATALVGAHMDEDPNGPRAGSAYVFSRSDRDWDHQVKLVPPDGNPGDNFGLQLALSGDGTVALVGAPSDSNSNGEGAGATYVFSLENSTWNREAKLAPSGGDANDEFGGSVALSRDGTTALVGAWRDDDAGAEFVGSTYVFSRTSDGWMHEAILAANDGEEDDFFGESVALSSDGRTALIGAFGDGDPNGGDAGSAYVFSRESQSWTREAKLVPEDGDENGHFGGAVALSGDGRIALLGARGDENPNGEEAGSAYVFSATDGSWSQVVKITPETGTAFDHFGASVALAGSTPKALLGAPSDDTRTNGKGSGSAYVYDR